MEARQSGKFTALCSMYYQETTGVGESPNLRNMELNAFPGLAGATSHDAALTYDSKNSGASRALSQIFIISASNSQTI
jgi:hypothetical protein